MTMAYVWAAMAVCSVVCGLITGRTGAVSAAALEGAGAAVQLCISLAGILCLWSGFMEILKRTGLEAHLARLLRPVLRRLLPRACRDGETMAAVSGNLSANLLGLGNARHPPWHPGRPAHESGRRGHSLRRTVPSGGAEHRIGAAAAHHSGRGAGCLRRGDAL